MFATFACAVPVQAEVYRCMSGGSVTYTDTPCPKEKATPEQARSPDRRVPTSNSVPTSPAPTFAGFYGEWHGQAQYQATVKGQPVESAHAVVDLIVTVGAKGKITGESDGNGCRALGVASPSNSQMMALDVSLSGCSYAGYSRRYSGTLALPPDQGFVRLSLVAYESRPGQPAAMYDVKATMRR